MLLPTLFMLLTIGQFTYGQNVHGEIEITKISDLDFGTAFLGDEEKVINPGTYENAENASFLAQGHPFKVFAILLPWRISMQSDHSNQKIWVDNFVSNPFKFGIIGLKGSSHIYVGARRARIKNNQKTGRYVGTFIMTVIY